jgi:DNA repair protein RecO (recombination protein O)
MEWTDEAVVLGLKRHGESAVILEAMTAEHGRHLGLVRGGRSARLAPVLQAGNRVSLTWRARLDDHLGNFQVEPLRLRAGLLMGDAAALYGLSHLTALMRLLPERDPQPDLHAALDVVIEHLGAPAIAAVLLVRFELAVLGALGFGLDLAACAVTGATQDLIYVSPKTGRAVSSRAGAAYADRLLPLPAFVRETFAGAGVTAAEARAGLGLSGHFLRRHVYEPRGLDPPDQRAAFIAAALREGDPA